MLGKVFGHLCVVERSVRVNKAIAKAIHSLQPFCHIVRDNSFAREEHWYIPLPFGPGATIGEHILRDIKKRFNRANELPRSKLRGIGSSVVMRTSSSSGFVPVHGGFVCSS